MNGDNVMAAPSTVVGDLFRAEKPRLWSPTPVRWGGGTDPRYDLHSDGKRLAVVAAADQGGVHDRVVFMSNFFNYLRRIAPVKE